jgi:AbiU2
VRIGASYASNTFLTVRTALRREMLLALMRLWDNDSRVVSMISIGNTLRDKRVVDAFTADRVGRLGLPESYSMMRQELSQFANGAVALIEKYSKGGSHDGVLEKLQRLRHERLAHRNITTIKIAGADATDAEVESFYLDMAKLISLLLHLVEATAYDPMETAHVYQHHAKFFWAGVRGERTEGHPNFRAPSAMHKPYRLCENSTE